jgi:hypothetical protein
MRAGLCRHHWQQTRRGLQRDAAQITTGLASTDAERKPASFTLKRTSVGTSGGITG